MNILVTLLVVVVLVSSSSSSSSSRHIRIDVVDDKTGHGVPLVMLTTNFYTRYFSDSAGRVAIENDLENQNVWFSVLTDGYDLNVERTKGAVQYGSPYDAGIVVNLTNDEEHVVYMKRNQIARRAYRLTGQGLYRDSVLTNASIPDSARNRAMIDPLSGVTGQDTLQVVNYQNAVWYFFGDTVCPRSARQNNCDSTGMYTVGAVSSTIEKARTDPPTFEYIAVGGSPTPIAPLYPLEQNTWTAAMFTSSDEKDMYAAYFKNPGDGASPSEARQGMMIWNGTQMVELGNEWPRDTTLSLNGAHTIQVLSPKDMASGMNDFAWFVNGAVSSRVRRTRNDVANYSAFEKLDPPKSPSYSCNTVNWNTYAQKYLCLGDNKVGNNESFGGTVPLTIAWSDSLLGPYVNATVILDHGRTGMSCYNGLHLPHMDQDQFVTVACTFTAMWSNTNRTPNLWSTCLFGQNSHQGCARVVPRYEYNNIVSKVDLDLIL